MTLLQLLFTYLQQLFGSELLQPVAWLIIVACGLLLTLVEVEKMAWRRIKTQRQKTR